MGGRAQKIIGWISVALSMVILSRSLIRLPFLSLGYLLPQSVFSVLIGIESALLIIIWGLAYVSIDKKETIALNIMTCFIGSLVYLAGACLPQEASLVLRNIALLASSVFFVLLCPFSFITHPDGVSAKKSSVVGFFLLRALLGFAAGFTSVVGYFYQADQGRNIILSVMAGICLVLLLVLLLFLPDQKRSTLLPVVPMIVFGVAVTPVLGNESPYLPAVASVIIWLSWITLSSTQLSEVSRVFPLSAVTLVASEKLVFYTFRPTGIVAAVFLCTSFGEQTALLPSLIITYLSVTVIVALLAGLSATREREKIIQQAAEEQDFSYAQVYAQISEEFGLTEREAEVFALLAEGMTKPHIAEVLSISEGTVRTHTKSIYRKLGCNKREQLQDIVNRRRHPLVE